MLILGNFLVTTMATLFVLTCLFMMLVILIQKPKGGGLSGAFGGAGGSAQAAFGAKTGDLLTMITIACFVLFLGLAIGLVYAIRDEVTPSIPAVTPVTETAIPPADAGPPTEAEAEENVFPVSSLDGRGMGALWSALEKAVDGFGMREAMTLGVILNERHLFRLEECRREIADLLEELDTGSPGDEVVGSLLSSILGQLGEISGRVFSEQVLETIFRRFCVGK